MSEVDPLWIIVGWPIGILIYGLVWAVCLLGRQIYESLQRHRRSRR